MKHTSTLAVAFLLVLAALTSCGKEDDETIDKLTETGILGKWKLESIMIDGNLEKTSVRKVSR